MARGSSPFETWQSLAGSVERLPCNADLRSSVCRIELSVLGNRIAGVDGCIRMDGDLGGVGELMVVADAVGRLADPLLAFDAAFEA